MTATQHATHIGGFDSLTSEVSQKNLPVKGSIPTWLEGILLRNGPAHYGSGRTGVRHWFDGQAMIHRFSLSGGEVGYSNRFLDTPPKRALVDRGVIDYPEFATDPCQSLFKKVFTTFSKKPHTSNAAVSIVPMGADVVALTESPIPIQFDPNTLQTLGVVRYDDGLKGHVTTAHPQRRPSDGSLVNYLLRFSRDSTYLIYTQPPDGLSRTEVARIKVEKPSYMHSFAVTDRYAILVEFPLVVDPLSFVLRRRPFIENYRWRPERGTQVTLIDLDDGTVIPHRLEKPIFAFHHVNAFHDGDQVNVDLVAYEDSSIVDSFYLDRLRDGTPMPAAKLVRLTVNTATGTVGHRTLSEDSCELPRIDPDRNGRPYRYVYGGGVRHPGNFIDEVVKINVTTGETLHFSEPGTHPGEPVFIPRPGRELGPDGEDDGVVATVVLDAHNGSSFLTILDARSFTELGRAQAPHKIPLGFHGAFVAR